MPLDKDQLKESIKTDLSTTIAQSLTETQEALSIALKDSDGGFYSALTNIKNRAEALAGTDVSQFVPAVQLIVSEEFAKTISKKIVEALNSTWVEKVSEALAKCISTRIDEYIKSAEIRVPPGASVYVPPPSTGVGASAGQAYVQGISNPATIR
jgi:hypothetical protein